MNLAEMITRSIQSLFLASLTLTSAFAQEAPVPESNPEAENTLAKYSWQTTGTGNLSGHATIEIPEGFVFLNGKETADVMTKEFGNLPTTYEGMIGPESLDWFVVFEFDDIGYVKDDEKDDLDADEILEAIQENQEAANEERKRRGLDTLTTTGWAVEPNYNQSTNNLEYGFTLKSSDGSTNVNFLTKLLGRRGVMVSTLLCGPDQLDTILPEYQKLLTTYQYISGETYAEYQEGDKVSEYGLKALVAGGAIFAAAKLGLFATIALWFKKAFKLVIAGVIAVGVFLKRMISGKKADA